MSGTRGWLFLCNNDTEDECFEKSLVGTMHRHLHRLRYLLPGDPVLLYNYQAGQLVGHFSATSTPQLDLVPEAWKGRFRAQVAVKLEARFDRPVPRKKLEAIPDLNFDSRGYLTNFSLPVEVVLEIVDIAAGRKKKARQVSSEAERSFRLRFPAKFFGSDGHRVRSRGELLIDNWLYTQRPPIAHAYERRLPVREEAYCDFYIPLGNCYIEYWGLGSREYRERRERKTEIYEKHRLQLISLNNEDIPELDDRLPRKLLPYMPEDFQMQ